jgi:ferredoxin
MNNIADPGLLQEVRRYGRFDVNGCLNCGSCTVVCDLSNGHASFPRRVIQRTILGLKDSLLGSLEPWLCHDCGDCSTACPRQAEPRESMMTLRRYLAAQYDLTGLSSKILLSKKWELIGICFTAVLVLALVVLYHLYYVQLPASDFVSTEMGLEHMFGTIQYFTTSVFLLPLFIMLSNAIRMYRFTMRGNVRPKVPLRLFLVEIKTIIVQMVSHQNILKCVKSVSSKRWKEHWLLGFGFALMSVILVFFLQWFQTDNIYPVYHPQRWLGYLATVALIVGPLDIIVGRLKKRGEMYKFSELSDFMLPIMLLLVAVSGIGVHVLRYLGFALACHYTYALHLAIAVPLLIIELPFGKLAHVIYRPLALYFQAVQDRVLAEEESLVKQPPTETIAA